MSKKRTRANPDEVSMLEGPLDYRVTFCAAETSSGRENFGIREDDVDVVFDPKYDRVPHASDAGIELAWESKLEKHATGRLWDASKYRLHSAGVDAKTKRVTLKLGTTSYKEYVGTHTSSRPAGERETLLRDGDAAGSKNTHLSCSLGIESVLRTADGGIVLLRRSDQVAVQPGKFNGPAGHPEPSDASGTDAAAAKAVIFHSALKETHEETGVPLGSMSPPRLIGGMIDAEGKPILLFLTETSLTAAEVASTYASAGAASDAWESSGLHVVSATPSVAVECRESDTAGGTDGLRVGEPSVVDAGVRGDVGGEKAATAKTRDENRRVASNAESEATLTSGFNPSLTRQYWARSETFSSVTRAAVDCVYMLEATSGDVEDATRLTSRAHVWENALDAAMDHDLDAVAGVIERLNLSHLGMGGF